MGTDNLHLKRKARQDRDIERQKAKLEPYDRVLIVCEDSNSSPAYLTAICDKLKLSTVNVEIHGEKCDSDPLGSDPISVVECAIKLMSKDKGYDRVFCVIDRDQHKNFQEALQKAKNRKKIKMIVSIPCFEYWLLLHFEFTSQVFQAVSASGSHCDTVISALKKRHLHRLRLSYDKKDGFWEKNYSLFETRQGDAIKHAKQREQACQHEPIEQRNPYTELHHLVGYLSHLKSPKRDSQCTKKKD